MTLDSLLSSNRDNFVTSVTSCNVGDVTRKPACIKDVTLVTPVTSQNINSQIEIIENWLFSINEPEEGYHLVLDKCRNDPEAMAYFLKYASGEFDTKPTLTVDDSFNGRTIGKNEAIEIISNWMIAGGRPPADYLFRLIVEKCENDPAARAHFLREALASEARRQSVINEKVVSLADHDDRRKCADCAFLDRGGYCQQWKRTNPHNSRYRPVRDVLRRCLAFKTKEDR